ncbi:hypothetical protein [Myceligenerans pegani]|uniref:Uncharacterized protein n=1 Tax=Myceligenerans pegani TaxID=2776917 RepID=A0ABR9N680_9MICO|nr:hypothetical protein [Myceligenerans sp. TRM 65318]MBE1878786.1 hypothetical protein [Myceligenerans sp. TRM 65318]MBE3021057.1 hypothetical protein [Myceligenerans sp. TRM 65318]
MPTSVVVSQAVSGTSLLRDVLSGRHEPVHDGDPGIRGLRPLPGGAAATGSASARAR